MDPISLQKSIRDNSEDLQNFMRDLQYWEADMKRKDKDISGPCENEKVPPVRSRIKKQRKTEDNKALKTEEVKVTEKPKRILSSDYSTWEKFDVDKACAEIDKENEKLDAAEEEDEDSSDEQTEEERLHVKALYEKELGNAYVKKGKWTDAINSYSKAIKYYNKDAIFYANRALCYLKTKQLKLAEDDCTRSLSLDSRYVKSYQRRAAVRIEMKKYEDARSDLNMVLRLEPNNLQAKKDLEILPGSKKPSELPKPTTVSKTQSSQMDSKAKPVAVKSVPKEIPLKQTKRCDITPWGEVEPSRIVHPLKKPPHLRSKKPLRRIPIIDVDDTKIADAKKDARTETNIDSAVCAKLVNNIQSTKEPCTNTQSILVSSSPKSLKDERVEENKVQNEKIYAASQALVNGSTSNVPPPPKNSVQFNVAWNRMKTNPGQLYLYLRQIQGNQLPFIFLDSLESSTFSGIISVLSSEFINRSTPVFEYLDGLSSVRRFRALVLFMSKQDKEGVTKLLDYCLAKKEITKTQVTELQAKFELQ